MGIIGLIEGIVYLSKSDEEFYETYVVGKKGGSESGRAGLNQALRLTAS